MKYVYKCSNFAQKDYKRLVSNPGKKKRVAELITKMEDDPWCYKYEKLNDKGGWMSRRINDQHRMVYDVNKDAHLIYFVYMYGHYTNMGEYRPIPQHIIDEVMGKK